MRVSDSHISPSCVAARRARRAGAGHLMLLSPAPSVRGHDHRPQHPTTSHHLRGHCRGEHGATLTSPPSALPRLLRRLTHCPRRLLFWVLFCQYSRVSFSYSSLRVIITRCPSTRIVTITTILHLSPNIFLMLKYFYRVKIFPPHRSVVSRRPVSPRLGCGVRTRGPLAVWHRPATAATPRTWPCHHQGYCRDTGISRLQTLPVPGTLPHVTTRDTAHSVSECGFQVPKTYQAAAHIWGLPR